MQYERLNEEGENNELGQPDPPTQCLASFIQSEIASDQQTAPVQQRNDHTSRGEDNQRDNTSIPQIELLSNPSNADANQNFSRRGDQDARPCVVLIGDSIIKKHNSTEAFAEKSP